MRLGTELIGSRLVAKVNLHNYTFPSNRSEIVPGKFAVVRFDIIEIIEGELPVEFSSRIPSVSPIIPVSGYNMPKMDTESTYIFIGVLKTDKKFGLQYESENVYLDYDLSSKEDQIAFFSYFLSEARIKSLFDMYDNPIKLLENKDMDSLLKINGVGEFTALRMLLRYEEAKNNSRAYIAFRDLGLTKNAIDKIVERYGSPDIAIDKVNSNPYILITEVKGYGWAKADAIALKQGFTRDCPERIKAYTKYYLDSQATANGNSAIPVNDLVLNVCSECSPATKEKVVACLKEEMDNIEGLEQWCKEHRIFDNYSDHKLLFHDRNTKQVGLFSLRAIEKEIAFHLKRLSSAANLVEYDEFLVNKVIKETEKEVKFEYTDEQKQAVHNIIKNNVSILTGSSGTGKSHTLKPVIEVFKKYKMKVEQCALAGRAASLLSEITGIEGKTIHRLLGYLAESETYSHTERNPLKADVIILDETSMVGEELFLSLVSSIKTGAKLILLGDVKQLPPLAVGNILNDCLKSGYISTNVLTQIHRQAMKSGIISQSFRVCNGESLCKNDYCGSEIRGDLKDFKLVGTYNKDLIYPNIIKEFNELYVGRQIPISQIQIIVPNKTNSDVSCRAINKAIQDIVNPEGNDKSVKITLTENKTTYDITFKPNDRVIATKNNYHILTIKGEETAVFNGNIGLIRDISNDLMTIYFPEQGLVVYSREDWKDLNLAYCISVHKLQGSQAPYVIVGICYSAYALLSRELVYTAITRATKYCVLVSQPAALNYAIKTSSIKYKQTWLKKDLQDYALEEQ